jgi:hypothetical protein
MTLTGLFAVAGVLAAFGFFLLGVAAWFALREAGRTVDRILRETFTRDE